MKVVALESVVDILDNLRFPVNSTERANRIGLVPYYGATGQVGTIDKAIFNETLILLGEDGVPFFDSTKHKAYEISGPSWVNNHAHVIRAKSELIVQRYLLHFLNSFNYTGYVNGATRLKLTQGDMKRIPIPLPSLAEQRAIVEKLDRVFSELDETKGKTSSVLEKLDLVFDSVIDGILRTQMKAGGQRKLVEVLDIARGGSPRPIESYLTSDDDGVNWVKIGDATLSKKYITKTAQKIKPSGVSRSRLVNPGDFLLSNSMSFGRPYIMATSGCIHDGWLVLSNTKKLLNQDYLYYILGSKFIYNQFNRAAAGSTVRNLNIAIAGEVTFPVPDLSTQEAIAASLLELEKSLDILRESLRNKLAKLEELKSAFLAEAFELGDSAEAVA